MIILIITEHLKVTTYDKSISQGKMRISLHSED